MNYFELCFFKIISLGAQFGQLYNFTKNVGWRLIFDLNQMLRTADNHWNSTNAQLLINYTSSKGYDFDFELGNGK